MPCVDPHADEDAIDELVQKVNRLTEMLCATCAVTPPSFIPQHVRQWYAQHVRDDEKRKRAEAADAEYQKQLREWEKTKPKRKRVK
jgi:hypothetical protein